MSAAFLVDAQANSCLYVFVFFIFYFGKHGVCTFYVVWNISQNISVYC